MDLDEDRLNEMKDTLKNAVNHYVEERREEIEELAEYGGGGSEGYKFAAHALRQDYEEAADIIDADPATVEQDVGHIVEDLYDDAQKGREQASTVIGDAIDVFSPVIDTVRKGDYASIPDALEETKDRGYQRVGQYFLENVVGQGDTDLDFGELLGDLQDGDPGEALDDQLGDLLDGLDEDKMDDLADLVDLPDDADDPVYEPDDTSDADDPVYEPDETVDDPSYEPDDTSDADDPSYETDEASDEEASDENDTEEEVEDDPSAFPVDPRARKDENADDADDEE